MFLLNLYRFSDFFKIKEEYGCKRNNGRHQLIIKNETIFIPFQMKDQNIRVIEPISNDVTKKATFSTNIGDQIWVKI